MATIEGICGYESRTASPSAYGPGGVAGNSTFSGSPSMSTGWAHSINGFGGAASLLAAKSAVATASYHQLAFTASQTLLVLRGYFKVTTLPTTNTEFLVDILLNNTTKGRVQITTAGVIQAVANATAISGPTVSAGDVIRVDCRLNVANNPWVMDVVIYNETTATLHSPIQATSATAGSNLNRFRAGVASSNTNTVSVGVDDLAWSFTTGDYPLGPGYVTLFRPNVTGTHSQSAGDFKDDAGTNITNGDGSYAKLTEVAPDTTSWIRQLAGTSSEYVEYGFADPSQGANDTPRSVHAMVGWTASATTGNNSTTKLRDGSSEATIQSGGQAATTLTMYGTFLATPPSGGSWSDSLIQSLLLRHGFSTTLTSFIRLTWAGLEVEYRFPTEITDSGTVTAVAAFTATEPDSYSESGSLTAAALIGSDTEVIADAGTDTSIAVVTSSEVAADEGFASTVVAAAGAEALADESSLTSVASVTGSDAFAEDASLTVVVVVSGDEALADEGSLTALVLNLADEIYPDAGTCDVTSVCAGDEALADASSVTVVVSVSTALEGPKESATLTVLVVASMVFEAFAEEASVITTAGMDGAVPGTSDEGTIPSGVTLSHSYSVAGALGSDSGTVTVVVVPGKVLEAKRVVATVTVVAVLTAKSHGKGDTGFSTLVLVGSGREALADRGTGTVLVVLTAAPPNIADAATVTATVVLNDTILVVDSGSVTVFSTFTALVEAGSDSGSVSPVSIFTVTEALAEDGLILVGAITYTESFLSSDEATVEVLANHSGELQAFVDQGSLTSVAVPALGVDGVKEFGRVDVHVVPAGDGLATFYGLLDAHVVVSGVGHRKSAPTIKGYAFGSLAVTGAEGSVREYPVSGDVYPSRLPE